MNIETLLLTPGPVQVPRAVLEAGAASITHHNAPEFQAVFKPLLRDLRPFFGNDGPILVQNSSGRGAMEASLTNLFNPGDAVAVLVNGRFGLRFAAIAKDMDLIVHAVSPEWGRTASESVIVDTLTRHAEIKGLIGCLCETGTGVMNDLEMVGRIGKRFGVITVIDAVSAAAGVPINMRQQNVDVCFSGIQKCFMCPPGLALIAINERAWKTIADCRHYRHYFNWVKMRDWIEAPKARMMGTPPESLIRSLACAVSMMHAEGLPRVYARHVLLGDAFRAFVHGAGCTLAAKEPKYYSNTVSAMELPEGIKAADLVRRVRENDNIAISTGQDSLKETAIRVGHMGPVQPAMLERGVHAIGRALIELGMQGERVKCGVDACARVLAHTTHRESRFAISSGP